MIPFRMGDVVRISDPDFEGKAIIHEAVFCGDSFEYSTTNGAWVAHEDCKLVSKANKKSLEELRKSLEDEGDYDD